MSHTGAVIRRQAYVTRRRVAAHACPACRRLWALRGVRTDTGAWLVVCAFCEWNDLRSPPPRPGDPPGPPDRPADAGTSGVATGTARTPSGGSADRGSAVAAPGHRPT